MIKQKKFINFEIISLITAMLIGTLLHFTYNWSHKNTFISLFSAINESPWEHLKLVFYPLLLVLIIGSFYHKNYPQYLYIKTKSIILACLFIIIFYFTYTGALGVNIGLINILSFFIALILSEIYTFKKITKKSCSNYLSLLILLLCLFSFIYFTFYPLNIPLFKSPV